MSRWQRPVVFQTSIAEEASQKHVDCVKFAFTHLADAFIQSNLHCIQCTHLISLCIP